jgi:anti-sigma-K factor RskA
VSPEIHTLAGAYALHALGDIERRQFEGHLAECPDCQQQVAEFHATAARLAMAVAEQPSSQLRQRVLAEVSQTRQEPPPISETRGRATEGRAWPTRRWSLRLAAAAAVLVALALGVVIGQTRAGLDTRDELTTAQAHYDKLTRLLSAPDLRIAVGQTADGDGSATVAVSRQLDQGVLAATGLPRTPAGHQYQAWLIGTTGPRSAGLLDPASTPPLLFTGLGNADQIGVTVEPDGGSPQPTTTPILLFPMPT